jgi:FtsP/CotA-like multicopper oxidase with cupredoxin domain
MVQQFDAFDSDNENDPSPTALRLPSGQYDVPLAFSDYILNTDGSLFFDQLEDKGQAGNLFCVNGKIQPYFNVAARKYRFRLLCATQGRHYEFYLSNNAPFQVIASDGGLLEAPVTMRRLYMVPGERYDIIIDFSGYPLGTQIALMNDLFHIDGNKPEDIRVPQPQLLFVVDRNAPDPSQVPQRLMVIPPPDVSNVVATRRIEFDRRNGGWQINRRFWDPTRPLFTAKANTTERWHLIVGGGGWHHPFHVHIDSIRILSRNRRPAAVPLHERGRKDVVNVPGGQQAEVLMKIHSYTGRYMLHCHNPAHEDLYMMGWVDVRP